MAPGATVPERVSALLGEQEGLALLVAAGQPAPEVGVDSLVAMARDAGGRDEAVEALAAEALAQAASSVGRGASSLSCLLAGAALSGLGAGLLACWALGWGLGGWALPAGLSLFAAAALAAARALSLRRGAGEAARTAAAALYCACWLCDPGSVPEPKAAPPAPAPFAVELDREGLDRSCDRAWSLAQAAKRAAGRCRAAGWAPLAWWALGGPVWALGLWAAALGARWALGGVADAASGHYERLRAERLRRDALSLPEGRGR